MQKTIPHEYIAIEGNIGAGKTTLCHMLAKHLGARLILEEFADNPFLPFFYEQPERYAFPVELFFMTERHKQLQALRPQQDLFGELTIADYIFVKTLLFARHTLSQEEFKLFSRLYQILAQMAPKPDLLVYLHRSIPSLLKNIKNRNRDYEQDIQADYLERVQAAYFEYFKTIDEIPILIIDVDEMDFESNEQHFKSILEGLSHSYQPGIHHLSFVNG